MDAARCRRRLRAHAIRHNGVVNAAFRPRSSHPDNPLQRLASMRWLSALLILVVGLGARPLFGIGVPTMALLVIAASLVLWNVFTRRHPAQATTATILMDLLVDLAAWASFLYLTGGATNPMASLLLPLIAAGATLLPVGAAWLLASLAIGIYGSLWFIHRPLYLPDPDQATLWHLAGMEATFAVSAGVIVWYVSRLTQTIRQRDQTLAAAREHALRNERVLALANQAASAAHELGTPLASMRLLVTEMIPHTIDRDTQDDLRLIDEQIEQCKRILSRLTQTAGRARAADRTPIPVNAWLEAQINGLRQQWPAARITLTPSTDNPRLNTDVSLDHAVHNLLTNAIKASPDASADIEAHTRGAMVDIRIRDNGPGIPDNILSLANADSRPHLPGEGLGIGLILTQTAIESHGGSLIYERPAEGGTVAIMTLPTTP